VCHDRPRPSFRLHVKGAHEPRMAQASARLAGVSFLLRPRVACMIDLPSTHHLVQLAWRTRIGATAHMTSTAKQESNRTGKLDVVNDICCV